MEDNELYDGFDKEQMVEYAKEAKERWGHTEAYKQSQERVKKMTKEDMDRLREDGDKFMKVVATHINDDPKSPEVQKLIDQHYNALRTFYEPNLEMYRGLATMYVDDSRFAAFYEKYAKGLSVFMRDAMYAYCDTRS